MKVALRFDIELDEEGMSAYFETHPGFVIEGEEPIDVLIREAITSWDFEGLIRDARGHVLPPMLSPASA